MSIKDDQGHSWIALETDHPFLTQWKCENCDVKTYTQDGCFPAELPKLITRCPNQECEHNWVMEGHNAGDPICSKCFTSSIKETVDKNKGLNPTCEEALRKILDTNTTSHCSTTWHKLCIIQEIANKALDKSK